MKHTTKFRKATWIVLSCLMLSVLLGCKEEKVKENSSDISIFGKWKLDQQYSNPPSTGWEKVENGYTVHIKSTNVFYSNQFDGCFDGAINLEDKQIKFDYSCEDFSAEYENPKGIFLYEYTLLDNTLELIPINYSCFEGCKYKFIKILN